MELPVGNGGLCVCTSAVMGMTDGQVIIGGVVLACFLKKRDWFVIEGVVTDKGRINKLAMCPTFILFP